MAVFMVICMVLMFRMMRSIGGRGMCGFWRWFDPRDAAYADGRARCPERWPKTTAESIRT